MDGFKRKILVDKWVHEQKLAKNLQIGWFDCQILVDGWVQESKLAKKKLVDGWVYAENFGTLRARINRAPLFIFSGFFSKNGVKNSCKKAI